MTSRFLSFQKTRIAPTPSGFLHVGNVLSFALTASLAQQTNARILLRIDDLDRERADNIYVQDIFDTLQFMEIPWHDGPRNLQEYESSWSQLRRIELYQKALNSLKESGQLFACTCSRTQIRRRNNNDAYPGTCRHKAIPLEEKNVSWRLLTSPTEQLMIKTRSGTIATTLPVSMQDFIVRKKDGFPAYQLSSLIDDVHYGVDLIVRGEDLWDSTLAQHYLAVKLGAEAFRTATFYHHPLLTAASGMKLSKSAGATSIQYLRKQGMTATDIYASIAQMLKMEKTVINWQSLGDGLLQQGNHHRL